jgi:hypothetical protein
LEPETKSLMERARKELGISQPKPLTGDDLPPKSLK